MKLSFAELRTITSHGIYSLRELPLMSAFQHWKDAQLTPLLYLLEYLGITPNIVSAVSGLTTIVGLGIAQQNNQPSIFIAALWLHLLLDGIDGPLARRGSPLGAKLARGGRLTPSGILADVTADYLGILAASYYLVWQNITTTTGTIVFVALYAAVLGLAWLRNRFNQPYELVIRPRLFVYGALTLDYIVGTTITAPVVVLSIALLAIASLTGTIAVVNHLRVLYFNSSKQ